MRKRSDLMFTFFHILPLSESQRWGGVPWLSSMAIFAASWQAKLHQRKKRTPKKKSAKKVSFCHKRNINVIEIIYVFLVTIFGCWVLDREKNPRLKTGWTYLNVDMSLFKFWWHPTSAGWLPHLASLENTWGWGQVKTVPMTASHSTLGMHGVGSQVGSGS